MFGLPKIVRRLFCEVETGGSDSRQLKPVGKVGSDRRLAVDDRGQVIRRVADVRGQFLHVHAECRQDVFAQRFTWMRGSYIGIVGSCC